MGFMAAISELNESSLETLEQALETYTKAHSVACRMQAATTKNINLNII